RPDSPFGWIIAAYGLLVGVEGLAIGYAITSTLPSVAGRLGNGAAAAVLGVWIAAVGNGLLTLGLLLVPNGRLPSRPWRPLAWFVVGSPFLGALTSLLSPGELSHGGPNPLGVEGTQEFLPQIRSWTRTFLLIGFAGAVGSLLVRFRGAVGE